jgi:hypothetical protein
MGFHQMMMRFVLVQVYLIFFVVLICFKLVLLAILLLHFISKVIFFIGISVSLLVELSASFKPYFD